MKRLLIAVTLFLCSIVAAQAADVRAFQITAGLADFEYSMGGKGTVYFHRNQYEITAGQVPECVDPQNFAFARVLDASLMPMLASMVTPDDAISTALLSVRADCAGAKELWIKSIDIPDADRRYHLWRFGTSLVY